MCNSGVWSTSVHRRTLAEEEATWEQCWKNICSKGWWWILAFHNWFSFLLLSVVQEAALLLRFPKLSPPDFSTKKCLSNLCKPRPMSASLVRLHSVWASVQHRTWRAYLKAGAAPLPPSSYISRGCVASCHRLTVRFIATGRLSMEMQGRDAEECVPGAPEKDN